LYKWKISAKNCKGIELLEREATNHVFVGKTIKMGEADWRGDKEYICKTTKNSQMLQSANVT
jgi:hypothetical protein